MKSILLICTGNVCRSPMAEGLLRNMLGKQSDVEIASAGVGAVKGQPPSPEAIDVMAEDGIDISDYRSLPVTEAMIEKATMIFTMTNDHRAVIDALFPFAMDKTFLLREFSDGPLDIPDPIGRGKLVYRQCRDTLKRALKPIVEIIKKDMPLPTTTAHSTYEPSSRLRQVDPEIADAIAAEAKRQHEHIELIASENYTSQAVMEAQGSCLTNKYAEGYPGRRWYGGCENVDIVESLAIERAKKLFGSEYVNVQPHSGSQANMAVYFSVLKPGDRILTMDLAHGGHLTHGHKANFSGKLFEVSHYGVDQKSELINYEELANHAAQFKPKMITAGASAYSRIIDFEKMRQIADSVGAYLFVDMAHIAGLVAAGVHPSPVPHAHFVTTTTHKSLRGPRAGLILSREEFAKKIDSNVFPGIQGGPLMHIIAAKAVCLSEALLPSFRDYAQQIVSNAKAMAARLNMLGYRIVSGGTDNHLLLVDLRPSGLTGVDAQEALDKAGITVNKNAIPFDTEPITKTGGIRIGTPAMTTRGMREEEMMEIAELIHEALQKRQDDNVLAGVRSRVVKLTSRFPLP